MLTYSELKSRCQKAMATPPIDDMEESVSVLCQNDWVRILVVRDKGIPEHLRIEVEVSLPSHSDPESGEGVKVFVKNLIEHLEYILRLDEEGLTLDAMFRDGLWTACMEFDTLPDDQLFKSLIPPSV